jgi:hypothetical protein
VYPKKEHKKNNLDFNQFIESRSLFDLLRLAPPAGWQLSGIRSSLSGIDRLNSFRITGRLHKSFRELQRRSNNIGICWKKLK